MKGKDFYEEFSKIFFENKKGEDMFLAFIFEKTDLTRYADSKIHQNTSFEKFSLYVAIKENNRIVMREYPNPLKDDVKYIIDTTYDMLSNVPENPNFPDFEGKREYREVSPFDENTYNTDPDKRAYVVNLIAKTLGDFKGFGLVNTGGVEIYLASTRGLSAYSRMSSAHVTVNAIKNDATGWSEAHAREFDSIDFEKIALESKNKAELSFEKIELPPGEYEVFLEPQAVSDIFTYMGYIGFSAKTYQEKRNFLIGKLGESIFSENITVIEDPFDISTFPFPFDGEGVPKQKIVLIDKGVPCNLVYDKTTAKKDGKISTGNAVGFPPSTFPYPTNIIIEQGTKTKEEILNSIDRGLYISRFHYTNIVSITDFVITGMTRDGTFLIEGGKIRKAVKNMRFTDSFIRTLREVELSRERKLLAEGGGYDLRLVTSVLAPYMKLKKLKFTSSTEF